MSMLSPPYISPLVVCLPAYCFWYLAVVRETRFSLSHYSHRQFADWLPTSITSEAAGAPLQPLPLSERERERQSERGSGRGRAGQRESQSYHRTWPVLGKLNYGASSPETLHCVGTALEPSRTLTTPTPPPPKPHALGGKFESPWSTTVLCVWRCCSPTCDFGVWR